MKERHLNCHQQPMGCDVQLAALRCQHFLWWPTNSVNYVRLTQLLVCDHTSSVGLCIQNYRSLHVAVIICTALVNTHTQTDSFWPVILLAQPAELKTIGVVHECLYSMHVAYASLSTGQHSHLSRNCNGSVSFISWNSQVLICLRCGTMKFSSYVWITLLSHNLIHQVWSKIK